MITSDHVVELSSVFKDLIGNIEKSKPILELQEDWDDEGSIGYSEQTFIQSVDFIVDYAKWIWEKLSIIIESPKILPGPDGSIDIFWKKQNYDLLINIPNFPNKVATFYGDDKKDNKIEGQFNIDSINQGIFLCLLNQK